MMTEFKLGEQVQYTHRLFRHHRDGRRIWDTIPIATPPVKGIIVGKRTLYDGKVDYGNWEEPTTFTAENHFEVYLVVTNIRQKPFPILPIHLTSLEGELDGRPEIPTGSVQPTVAVHTDAKLDHRDLIRGLARHYV